MSRQEVYNKYKNGNTIKYIEHHTASCLTGDQILLKVFWQAIKAAVETPTGFIVEERWADCGTDTVDRPLTQDEINQKFDQWWEYLTEYCTLCGEKGPCMHEGCDLWPYISIKGDPIRKVKP